MIEFIWNDEALCFADILHYSGQVPLPPYLNRNTEESDKESYQTVYAKHDGSVAAPTAGLHFDLAMIDKIRAKWFEKFGDKNPTTTEKMEFYHQMRNEGFDGYVVFDALKDKMPVK